MHLWAKNLWVCVCVKGQQQEDLLEKPALDLVHEE